jgi:hypothetical protein
MGTPNAGAQPCPKAEARHERTLEGIGCSALFGAPAEGGCGPARCPWVGGVLSPYQNVRMSSKMVSTSRRLPR